MNKLNLLLKFFTSVLFLFLFFTIFTTATNAQTFNCEYLNSGQCFPDFSNSIFANEHCNQFDGNRSQCEAQVNINDVSDSQNPNAAENIVEGKPVEENQFKCTINNDTTGVNTAIGCIPLEPSILVAFILRWAIGIGGGIAFLLILYSGFIIMTSSGNPERLKGGKELLTSAIAGLIMLIFSVFVLRVIGVDIIGISGF